MDFTPRKSLKLYYHFGVYTKSGKHPNACNEDSSYTDNHYFAHFLDCEAHTDVWRELFPTANKTNEK